MAGAYAKVGENVKQPCPKCGEEHANLPIHIRACDGGEG